MLNLINELGDDPIGLIYIITLVGWVYLGLTYRH